MLIIESRRCRSARSLRVRICSGGLGRRAMSRILPNSPFVRLYGKLANMGRHTGRKRSGSATMRYLDSSVHGKVPVLRAGEETYLWMPATSGGAHVWRHVLTRGTSPGSARKRIALKAGISKNLASQSTNELCKNSSSSPLSHKAPLKNWVN